MKGGPVRDIEKFSKKKRKMKIFSLIVPKNVKAGTLCDSLTYIQLQNIKKTRRGDPFKTLKNFQKKVEQCRKKIKGGGFSLVRFCRLP